MAHGRSANSSFLTFLLLLPPPTGSQHTPTFHIVALSVTFLRTRSLLSLLLSAALRATIFVLGVLQAAVKDLLTATTTELSTKAPFVFHSLTHGQAKHLLAQKKQCQRPPCVLSCIRVSHPVGVRQVRYTSELSQTPLPYRAN